MEIFMAVAKEQIRQMISENNISSVADVYSLLRESFKDILQELMEAELDASLGYEKNQKGDLTTSNKRNGHSPKTLKSHNVINLRKRTIPDVFTPIHGIKTSGIVLGISPTI